MSEKSPEQKLLGIVNSSGFLFQVGVETTVSRTYDQHAWKVNAREYPWSNNEGKSGYIDIILWKNDIRLVLECKRVRDTDWVFLALWDVEEARFRCSWADRASNGRPHAGWFDLLAQPASPEASFCIIRGQGENDTPMLERICTTLISSVDALAEEELRLAQARQYPYRAIYLPVVVTTARLHLCVADPQNISLSEGTVPEAQFRALPFIRFSKSLTTKLDPDADPREISEALKERERSIFVVNADHLIEFLEVVYPSGLKDANARWPWEAARARDLTNAPSHSID